MADTDTDDFLSQVTAMAEKVCKDDDEKKKYIHQHMTRAGYEAIPTYVKKEDGKDGKDGKDSGGGWFK
jgi:hypothetical protein